MNSWLAPGFLEQLRNSPPERIFAPGREHVGDIANLTGPLRGLRELFPSAHITVEVGERAIGVLENQGAVDRIWKRPTHQGFGGKLKHIQRIRRADFDLAVILDDSNDLVLQAALGGIPKRIGIWRGKKYQRLYHGWFRYQHDIHEVRDNGEGLLRLLGLPEGQCKPILFPSPRDKTAALEAWEAAGCPRIGIHPGASDPTRQGRPEILREVANAFKGEVVLLAGPGDERLLNAIDPDNMHPRILGGLSILGFASLLGHLDAFVGMDSGPMHLAAIMGTPVVALFGTADPRHTGPVGTTHVILRQAAIQDGREIVAAVNSLINSSRD